MAGRGGQRHGRQPRWSLAAAMFRRAQSRRQRSPAKLISAESRLHQSEGFPAAGLARAEPPQTELMGAAGGGGCWFVVG